MYAVSNLFKQYITQQDREFEVKAVVGTTTYNNSVVVEFAIEESAIPDQDFVLGAVIASKLTLSLRTSDTVAINEEIQPFVRLNGPSGYTEWVPLGNYYIDSRGYQNGVWSFTCYDDLIRTQQDYASSLVFPTSIQNVWNECMTQLGLTSDISVVVNPAYNIPYKPDGLYTIRDMMGYIAAAHACSVRMTKDGKVGWVKFAPGGTQTPITTSDYYSEQQTNPTKTYTAILLTYNTDGETLSAGSGDTDHTLNMYNPFMDQTILNNVFAIINGFTYTPFTMDWRSRPDLEIGDAVSVTCRDATVFTSTILTNKMTFKGGLRATVTAPSYAPQRSEFDYKGSLKQQVLQLQQNAVQQDKPYYGVTIGRTNGVKVEKSDGSGKAIFNSDVLELLNASDVPIFKVDSNGKLQIGTGAGTDADTLISSVDQLNDFVNVTYPTDIQNLQSQIDGNITSWFYGYAPTLTNVPASGWATDADKNNHLGDLFYDTTTGYAYRFALNGSTYSWIKITDTDVTTALANAATAQDTADHKRRVFYTTPVPPYDLGDLWAGGSGGDLQICNVAKASGQAYSAADWGLASKYTDDTTAKLALTNAANAQTAANNAQTTANNAQSSATTANNLLADIANDNKLTPDEKQTTKKEWDAIVSEVSLNDTQATNFGITTEKTNYDNAYNALNTYITPLLSSLTTTSVITGTTFRSNFKAYYDARTTLLNAIAAEAKTLADAAQSTANNAVTNAATAQTSADNANASLADIASDNKLTAVEKQTVKVQWDAIVAEQPILDSQATTYEVTTEKTNYDNAYNALNTYITPLLTDLTTTSDITGSTFRSNFSNYYTAKINLLNRITNVTSFTGQTIINGGQIETETLSVDKVTSNFGQALDISSNVSVTSKVDTADMASEIQQNADSVKIAVGQIGGNNLLQNTGKFQSLNWWAIREDASSAATLTIQNGTDNGVTFPALWFNVTAFSQWCNLHNDSISTMKFSTAKKYAFSARLYVSKAMTVQVGIMDANGANVVLGWQNYSLPYGYSSIECVFTPLVAGGSPILVIQGLGGTSLPYTIVLENCKLEEGENTTAWSPNPNELQQTNVTIDSTGMEVDNGALIVKNPSGTVVIDGTSNMFKITVSGTSVVTRPAGTGSTTVTITHNLGYIPFVSCFVKATDVSGATYYAPYGDSSYYRVKITTTQIQLILLSGMDYIDYSDGRQYLESSSVSRTVTFRYFICKEAAF